MPSLRLIVASGTAQRRLLEETVKEYEKKRIHFNVKTGGGGVGLPPVRQHVGRSV